MLLDEALTKHANAVFRLDEMSIHLKSKREMTYKVKQAVTVLNAAGNGFARTNLYYDKERKIKRIEARVFDKRGNETEHIKRKDFQDVSAVDGFSLYLDDRALRYRYTPVEYPYTLEFTYEVETSDTGIFPPWFFLPGYMASVEKSTYTISYASEALKPIINEYRLSEIEISKTEDNGKIVYSAQDIKAIKKESHCPPFNDISPKLLGRMTNFHYKGLDASVNDWNDLGSWVHRNLLQGRTQLPESTKNTVRNLVSGVTDHLEKAKLIYKYVQENTRYVSVQIGIGGFQPISALDVDQVKYGDCKGLTNYTKALLSVVGVKSYYTLVEAGGTKVDFLDDFPDLAQGNHAILAIPYNDMYYWVDCTSQVHPFGFVGDFTDDRKVLVVKPDGGELVKTVSYLNEQNYQKTKADCSLDENGQLSANLTITTLGTQYDNRFKLQEKSPEAIDKHYKDYWGVINNLKLTSYNFKNDQEQVKFIESLSILAENYSAKSGDRILFAPNAFNQNDYVPNRYRTRHLPFEISRGFLDEDEFSISLPKGYAIEALPNATKVENEFGHYNLSVVYEESDNTISYKRSLLIKEGSYTKEKYKSYRDFRKQVARMDRSQIVLLKNAN